MSQTQQPKRRPIINIPHDRIVMFSDGVFAIVLTLLVLEISAGDGSAWHDLRKALPELGLFAWSFFLGLRFWVLHVRLFGAITDKVPEDFADTNGLLLFFVALLPFATKFFSEHFHQAWGAAVYAIVIGMIGLMQARMRVRILGQISNETTEAAQAVRDAWPFIIIPVFMALSIPFAFLSSGVAYSVWGLFIVVNIVRGILVRAKSRALGV